MRAVLLSALFVAGPWFAQDDDDFDPIVVNAADAINCHIDARTYNAFALSLDSTEEKGAKRRGWRKIGGKNPFLAEFKLREPILVTGQYSTDHIALSSTAIMAVLDLADPAVLAKGEGIENLADPQTLFDGLIADGALTPEQAEQMPFANKFLGERVLVDESEDDAKLKLTFRTQIKRVISTVSSHPGKTLYGCSYRIDIIDQSESD